MDENIQSTVSETGTNSQVQTHQVNYDEIVNNIMNAIEKKNEKNERSIINDNMKQFSDEEGQLLRELISAQKNKIMNEEINKKVQEKDDIITKLQEEIGTYKNKERNNLLNNSLVSIYEELGITQEGSQKQAHRLALSGVDINTLFKEDGTVDNDKVKKAFEDVITDIPSLVDKKASKVVIKETNHDETDEAMEQRKNKRLKKWGLDKDNDNTGRTLSGYKSKLI